MKKSIPILMTIAIMIGCMPFASAATTVKVSEAEPEYLEFHQQINLENIDLEVTNGEVQASVSSDVPAANKAIYQPEVDDLMEFLDEYDEVADLFKACITKGKDLVAFSITEAPILLEDGHTKRVPVSQSDYFEESIASIKGYFALATMVERNPSEHVGSDLVYYTTTVGAWSKNSFVGGENYPSFGDDWVLQSVPNTWTTSSSYMTAKFDTNPTVGVEGDDFWEADGGDSYVKYVVRDDPLGWHQNKGFVLECTSAGPVSRGEQRIIHSYYVHTWASMSLDVSVSASSEDEVSLSLSPSLKEKSWSLHNKVDFTF